jgi:hypothetical protein
MSEEYHVQVRQKATGREIRERGHLDIVVQNDALRIAHGILSEVRARVVTVTASMWEPRSYRIRYS